MDDTEIVNSSSTTPKKGSLFKNRPKWAKSAVTESENNASNDTHIFRKKHVEPISHWNRSLAKAVETRSEHDNSKRRRIVANEASSALNRHLEEDEPESSLPRANVKRKSLSASPAKHHSGIPLSNRRTSPAVSKTQRLTDGSKVTAIDISSENEEEIENYSGITLQSGPRSIGAGLIGTANGPKENLRILASPSVKTSTPVDDPENADLIAESRARRKAQDDESPASQGPEAVVSILLHSQLPSTKPIIIQRKVTQRLKEIRLMWCAQNSLGDELSAKTFLTWRGTKVYDLATCKSLGMDVDITGTLSLRGQPQLSGMEGAQVEMEVVTPDLLQERKKVTQAASPDNSISEQATVSEPSSFRIILKAPGFADYKLIVKSDTPFSKIVKAFRKQRAVEPERQAFLMFDGERLDEDETVGQSDISDMDNVEVHIK